MAVARPAGSASSSLSANGVNRYSEHSRLETGRRLCEERMECGNLTFVGSMVYAAPVGRSPSPSSVGSVRRRPSLSLTRLDIYLQTERTVYIVAFVRLLPSSPFSPSRFAPNWFLPTYTDRLQASLENLNFEDIWRHC